MHVTHVQAYASPFQKSERQVLGWLFQRDLINSSKEHSQKSNTNDRWELNWVALTLLNSCLPGKAVLNNIMCVWSMRNGWLPHNRQHDGHQKREISWIWRNSGKKITRTVWRRQILQHIVWAFVFSLKDTVICLDEHWKRVQCTENKNGFLILLLF